MRQRAEQSTHSEST